MCIRINSHLMIWFSRSRSFHRGITFCFKTMGYFPSQNLTTFNTQKNSGCRLATARRFKVTFLSPSLSPSWRPLNLSRGHLAIPKRSQRIARWSVSFKTRFFRLSKLLVCFLWGNPWTSYLWIIVNSRVKSWAQTRCICSKPIVKDNNHWWFGILSTYRWYRYIYIYKYIHTIHIYTWNTYDPCFEWKRPSFGGFKPTRSRLQVYIDDICTYM